MADFLNHLNEYQGALALLALIFVVVIFWLLIVQMIRQKHVEDLARDASKAALRTLQEGVARPELYHLHEAQTSQLVQYFSEQSQNQSERFGELSTRLDNISQNTETRLDKMRETMAQSIANLQSDNSRKLEEMRQTVDEKLQTSLERRLGESFSLVSERLEQVYRGLGEMQNLASGVGDLKRVLTNVKTRGIWGEIQLGSLLAQILPAGQYDTNVAVVPLSSQRVEYAVRLPGNGDGIVYLPIDSKFPLEDYERLQETLDSGDPEMIAIATDALHTTLKVEARRIASKYIAPPSTTDFAIMFLPIEGLYAEALRAQGLAAELQEKYRIVIAGPTTLSALLTSLQVGFRTLAIEKRTGEVWQLLSAVKTEFSNFSKLLDATQKKMHAVSESLESASRKTRTIERKLRAVEGMDSHEAVRVLETDDLFTLSETDEPAEIDDSGETP